jgi:hypothetical protein
MRLSVTAVPEIIENGNTNTRLQNMKLYLTAQRCSTIAITELLQKNVFKGVAAPTVLICYFLQTLIMSPSTDCLRRQQFQVTQFQSSENLKIWIITFFNGPNFP